MDICGDDAKEFEEYIKRPITTVKGYNALKKARERYNKRKRESVESIYNMRA